jgi:hypothetical protein
VACKSVLRLFIPKETKEAMARQNAKLLMQAQSDLGLLATQMGAGEEGTKRQIEWYQHKQQQQYYPNVQQHHQQPHGYRQWNQQITHQQTGLPGNHATRSAGNENHPDCIIS